MGVGTAVGMLLVHPSGGEQALGEMEGDAMNANAPDHATTNSPRPRG